MHIQNRLKILTYTSYDRTRKTSTIFVLNSSVFNVIFNSYVHQKKKLYYINKSICMFSLMMSWHKSWCIIWQSHAIYIHIQIVTCVVNIFRIRLYSWEMLKCYSIDSWGKPFHSNRYYDWTYLAAQLAVQSNRLWTNSPIKYNVFKIKPNLFRSIASWWKFEWILRKGE